MVSAVVRTNDIMGINCETLKNAYKYFYLSTTTCVKVTCIEECTETVTQSSAVILGTNNAIAPLV